MEGVVYTTIDPVAVALISISMFLALCCLVRKLFMMAKTEKQRDGERRALFPRRDRYLPQDPDEKKTQEEILNLKGLSVLEKQFIYRARMNIASSSRTAG